jgi:hypothetical protein
LLKGGEKGLRTSTVFTPWIQVLEFVFHNVVERPVDNHVDKLDKSAMARLLDLIA